MVHVNPPHHAWMLEALILYAFCDCFSTYVSNVYSRALWNPLIFPKLFFSKLFFLFKFFWIPFFSILIFLDSFLMDKLNFINQKACLIN